MSCGVACRCSSDPVLLWLWLAAIALIRPLAWESPYAMGVALKRPKKKKKKKKKKFQRVERGQLKVTQCQDHMRLRGHCAPCIISFPGRKGRIGGRSTDKSHTPNSLYALLLPYIPYIEMKGVSKKCTWTQAARRGWDGHLGNRQWG